MENSKTEDASQKCAHDLYVTCFKKLKQLREKRKTKNKQLNNVVDKEDFHTKGISILSIWYIAHIA